MNRILGIAQIDPSDPGVGYFRDYALGRGDDVLELTRDGAATLAPMLSPGVQLSAFALADDGTRYSGSRAGMLWAAPPGGIRGSPPPGRGFPDAVALRIEVDRLAFAEE